jgi:hypothetical protein
MNIDELLQRLAEMGKEDKSHNNLHPIYNMGYRLKKTASTESWIFMQYRIHVTVVLYNET